MINFGKKLPEDRNYWITSDLHFGHKNIMKFCPKTRPFHSVNQMNNALIEHWNSLVQPDDVVFHLGDFSFLGGEATRTILDCLNGTIVFILGNHDKVIRNQISSPYKFDYFECRYMGQKLVMSHYAMREWNQKARGAIHFYGHSHGSLPGVGRSMDVGYDAVGSIMPLELLVNKMSRITILCVEDNHAK